MIKLQELKEAIIKANPEIFEWRCNGCNRKHSEYHNGCVYCWRDELSIEQNRKFFPKRKVMKIDRPIRLADVLSIIEERYEDDKNGNTVCTSEIKEIKDTLNRWEFSKGNIDNQSEETINFLHSILCN